MFSLTTTVVVAILLISTVSLSVALPVATDSRTHLEESLSSAPEGWSQGHVDSTTSIDLTVAVSLQNTDELVQTLLKISDPTSPEYGNWLSSERVHALTAPTSDAIHRVQQWFVSAGVTNFVTVANGAFIRATVPVDVASSMLQTKFYVFTHEETKQEIVRCLHYTVPVSVANDIDFVSPALRFPKVQSVRHRANVTDILGGSSSPSDETTPVTLRADYKIGDTVGTASKNSQAITSFLEQYYAPSDLSEFFDTFPSPSSDTTVSKVVGHNDETNPGIEASLDVEYIMAMGAGVSTQFWETAGRQPGTKGNEPFIAWLATLANTTDDDAPLVFSVSYADMENTVDAAYAVRVSNEFAKLGARGITVLVASGDHGVGGTSRRASPEFPASVPWVTVVGGTTPSFDKRNPLIGWSQSGGGFSDLFERPAYQDTAVTSYFANAKLPPKTFYNATGRAMPDVSAAATQFAIVLSGTHEPASGTSCASPTFAGVVSLLNDLRLQKGKPALGFLNPLIYSDKGLGSALTDITEGFNGVKTSKPVPMPGFHCAAGWDPVTGFGVPNYPNMAAVVDALP